MLAALAQAQDDGRTEDLVSLYAEDGAVDVPGIGTFAGASAPREAFAGWAPTVPQRHIVTNTLVTDWDGGSARAISDVSSSSAPSPAGGDDRGQVPRHVP